MRRRREVRVRGRLLLCAALLTGACGTPATAPPASSGAAPPAAPAPPPSAPRDPVQSPAPGAPSALPRQLGLPALLPPARWFGLPRGQPGPVIASTGDAPLAAVPGVPTGSGGYVALDRDGSGQPVRFDPCSPVPYVVRRGAPAAWRARLAAGLAEVSAATGLVFVDEGLTDEPPSADRSSYQPERYGERFAPVLVAFATAAEHPPVAGFAGLAGPTTQVVVGRGLAPAEPPLRLNVSGQVVFETAAFRRGEATAAGRAANRLTVLHELGHLVGLGHVDDPRQVMYAGGDGPALPGFADGDRRGLAQLGSARGCPRA